MPRSPPLRFEVSPSWSNEQLNRLYSEAWPHHTTFDFAPVLERSLGFVCAYRGDRLVGFVYLAWDGAQHAFLLEPTVSLGLRRQGIGKELVRRAVAVARKRGLEWVHVDFEPSVRNFYLACGFVPTEAGLIHLNRRSRRGRLSARPGQTGFVA